jgi:hypothetical protein
MKMMVYDRFTYAKQFDAFIHQRTGLPESQKIISAPAVDLQKEVQKGHVEGKHYSVKVGCSHNDKMLQHTDRLITNTGTTNALGRVSGSVNRTQHQLDRKIVACSTR